MLRSFKVIDVGTPRKLVSSAQLQTFFITGWTVVQAALTANFHSNEKGKKSTSDRIKTNDPTEMKFGTVNYVVQFM